jgi:hypothetical protein
MKLKEIGEFGFIDRIAPLGSFRSEGVVKGIGDDCAVISIGDLSTCCNHRSSGGEGISYELGLTRSDSAKA